MTLEEEAVVLAALEVAQEAANRKAREIREAADVAHKHAYFTARIMADGAQWDITKFWYKRKQLLQDLVEQVRQAREDEDDG